MRIIITIFWFDSRVISKRNIRGTADKHKETLGGYGRSNGEQLANDRNGQNWVVVAILT